MQVNRSISWETIKKYSKKAGLEVYALAEAVYLTLKDPELDFRHKALLSAALIYLVSPLDGIPDFLPTGYLDDLTILLAALRATGPVGQKHHKLCRLKHGLSIDDTSEKRG